MAVKPRDLSLSLGPSPRKDQVVHWFPYYQTTTKQLLGPKFIMLSSFEGWSKPLLSCLFKKECNVFQNDLTSFVLPATLKSSAKATLLCSNIYLYYFLVVDKKVTESLQARKAAIAVGSPWCLFQ